MRISTLVRYGTRAMLEIAQSYPRGVVSVKAISLSQEVSEKYLERILSELRVAGLVRAVRGVNGGYLLTRPPREITLDDVFQALGGPLVIVDCVRKPETCSRSPKCPTRLVWKQIHESVEKILKTTTLAYLAKTTRGKAGNPVGFLKDIPQAR